MACAQVIIFLIFMNTYCASFRKRESLQKLSASVQLFLAPSQNCPNCQQEHNALAPEHRVSGRLLKAVQA